MGAPAGLTLSDVKPHQLKNVVGLLGRRDTLKYGLVGMGAALLSACSRSSESESGDAPIESKSVIGQSISAFLAGKWTMDAPVVTDENTTYPPVSITVGKDGAWSIQWRGEPAWEENTRGRWGFKDGTLKIYGIEYMDPNSDGQYMEVTNVPSQLAASALLNYRDRDLEAEKDPALAAGDPFTALVEWNSNTQELTVPMHTGDTTPPVRAVFKRLGNS